MTTLAAFREALLSAPHPDRTLRLADQYLNTLTLMGNSFVLPAEHVEVLPVLEYYAGDLTGWVKFVKGVRDRLPQRSEERAAVHVLFRTLDVRLTQQQRRDRITQAVDNAVRAGKVQDDVLEKQRYARRVVQYWSKLRYAAMTSARSKGQRDRLTTEERSEVLEQFWADVDASLGAGEYPEP